MTSRQRASGSTAGALQDVHGVLDQAGVGELARREVDVDPQGAVLPVPFSPFTGLPYRLLQDPAAERHDQPGVLGERDEPVRAEHPVLRMQPAHQRLGAPHTAVAEVDQRLVLDEELAAVKGRGQRRGQSVPGDGAGVGLRVGQLEAVAARRLGPVHGDVGAAQDLRRAPLARGSLDDADAAAHGQLTAVDTDRGEQHVHDARREVVDLALGVGPGGQRHELVTAEPGHHLARGGRAGLEPVGDLDEQPVMRPRGRGCR